METDSKNLETVSKAGSGAMSSVAATIRLDDRSPKEVMRAVGKLLAPGLPAKSYYDKIRAALRKRLPDDFDVSERRVRAIHDGDARRVDWIEMKALLEIEALEEAIRARKELAATAIRLAALVEAEGPLLAGDELRALGQLSGAMDRAGIEAGQ
ncbi:MAG: hypothetical protein EOS72_03255 [Mesorhizobium sp.]|uniref:hypothetical protein n=1 Tax=Mesorhizobium sp. TaxID=1871066 RepID=UPI000FE4CF6D|nr:hypothetical protein [Mesorhizobium sp.]RWC91686.1 MAG: hypothetical protein EOS72_03255 [Mesorhizobium sp.]